MVPRPRLDLIRFHDVLAPNAKLREYVVPAGQHDDGAARPDSEAVEPNVSHRRASRISWARLLERVFEIDMERCPDCGDDLQLGLIPQLRILGRSTMLLTHRPRPVCSFVHQGD